MGTISRKPIKFRSSIQMDYCTCWGTKGMSYQAAPYLTTADHASLEQLRKYVEEVSYSTAMYVTYGEKDSLEKIKLFLSKNLPVYIRSKQILSEELVEVLKKSSHTAIRLCIDGFSQEDLQTSRLMLQELKSWGVSTILEVSFFPFMQSFLGLLDIIDRYKNIVSHLIVNTPSVPDEEVKLKYQDIIKGFYFPCLESRSWIIKEDYKKILNEKINLYVSQRKLDFDTGSGVEDENRIRYISDVEANNPFGLPNFIYKNTEEGFVYEKDRKDCGNCPRCNKPL